MNENYQNFLTNVNNYFDQIGKFELAGNSSDDDRQLQTSIKVINNHIKKFLIFIWGSLNYDDLTKISVPFKGNKKLGISFDTYIGREGTFKIIKSIMENHIFENFKNISNFDLNYLEKIANPTYSVLSNMMTNYSRKKLKIEISQEIVTIFIRSTQYPVGSFIPLGDVIKEDFIKAPLNIKIPLNAFEGIIYTMLKLNIEFPSPYHYSLASLENIKTNK